MQYRNGYLFHGGCLGCINNDLGECTGCCYLEYDWELPSKNPLHKEENERRIKMVKLAKMANNKEEV